MELLARSTQVCWELYAGQRGKAKVPGKSSASSHCTADKAAASWEGTQIGTDREM